MITVMDYKGIDTTWCPGCGNFAILNGLKQALIGLEIQPHEVVIYSGIGQAAKLPLYMKCNTLNGLHGRTLCYVTGSQFANHTIKTIAVGGDGDGFAEGGNHFLHVIRRNPDVAYFAHNNQVYRLTKGQASPTSDAGFVTKIQTHGVISLPLKPLALAIAQDCSFVARSFSGDPEHLHEMMVAALKHQGGFALLDILQPCVSFNRVNTFRWYKDRVRPVGGSHDPFDRKAAMELALGWGDEIPVGMIYRSNRPSFESQLSVLSDKTLCEQLASAG